MILQGIPASGKTTWAVEQIRNDARWKRVSRDDLRLMMNAQSFDPRFEDCVTIVEKNCVFALLMQGFNVIVDATHVKPQYVRAWVEFINTSFPQKVQMLVRRFPVEVEEALARNAKRHPMVKVPEYVIKRMFVSFENMKL